MFEVTNSSRKAQALHEFHGGYLLMLDEGRFCVCDYDTALQHRTQQQLIELDDNQWSDLILHGQQALF